jgi:2-polyprenyl-6-methoxyphenol hydroxylase-like FAD-dependent oxidoreductase
MAGTPGAPTVLVVGAGIGGLATALELHRLGLRCRVVEALEQFAPLGVGINVLPHASARLGALGLEDELSRHAVLTRESVFFNRFGQLVYGEPAGRDAGYADPQYSVHRADLHEVLLGAVRRRLGPGTVILGHRAIRVDQDEQQATVTLHSAGGGTTTVTADAVVAADGVHSAVRRQLFPTEGEPRYSGVMMWRGTSVWQPFLTGASMVRAGWLTHGKLVAYPVRDGVGSGDEQLVNWVAEVETPQRAPRDWTRRGRLEDCLPYFADWHFDWLDVPAMMRASRTVLEYPMVDQDPLPRWSHGRVTLLGDAAHPMVPRGSNGAGQAVLDAQAVAECLAADPGDPAGALAAYEQQRLPPTAAVVLANRANPPDAILRLVHERTGDRPFTRLEDVASREELARIADSYKQVAGLARPGGATGEDLQRQDWVGGTSAAAGPSS